jgi:hypothetical protein
MSLTLVLGPVVLSERVAGVADQRAPGAQDEEGGRGADRRRRRGQRHPTGGL